MNRAVPNTPDRATHHRRMLGALLERHGRDGGIDYDGLRADRASLDAYTGQLEAVCTEDFGTWSGKQRIAFWLNAYNAYTLQLILDNWPVQSIRDIGFLPLAFNKDFMSVPAYVADYLPEDQAAKVRSGSVKVEHLDYDWSLNDR